MFYLSFRICHYYYAEISYSPVHAVCSATIVLRHSIEYSLDIIIFVEFIVIFMLLGTVPEGKTKDSYPVGSKRFPNFFYSRFCRERNRYYLIWFTGTRILTFARIQEMSSWRCFDTELIGIMGKQRQIVCNIVRVLSSICTVLRCKQYLV
jgi:hypothetical protein